MTKQKKVADYIQREEKECTLAARLSNQKMCQIEQKMKRDKIRSKQDLVEGMVEKYLEEE